MCNKVRDYSRKENLGVDNDISHTEFLKNQTLSHLEDIREYHLNELAKVQDAINNVIKFNVR